MQESDIVPGEMYLINSHIFGESGMKVSKRENDNNFPFEVSAANFGITAKEIICSYDFSAYWAKFRKNKKSED